MRDLILREVLLSLSQSFSYSPFLSTISIYPYRMKFLVFREGSGLLKQLPWMHHVKILTGQITIPEMTLQSMDQTFKNPILIVVSSYSRPFRLDQIKPLRDPKRNTSKKTKVSTSTIAGPEGRLKK